MYTCISSSSLSPQDGIIVGNRPFKNIQSKSYHSIMADIFNGYFPSEFKNDYPDGVIFNLSGSNLTAHCFLLLFSLNALCLIIFY
jgi:hypothetical protein